MASNWKLRHVGIPVRDLDKSLEDYQSLGIASFQPEFLIDSSTYAEYLVYGKTPDPVVKTRVALGKMGPLGIELLQPVQGETVHKELLEKTDEGIGHIAYAVDDLEAEAAKLVAKGFQIILSIKRPGQTHRSAVYIDTRNKFSNLIIELIQDTERR
jgi:catechol 2,3-dioxygenase-like lactoylglutathione lyase family enzyme